MGEIGEVQVACDYTFLAQMFGDRSRLSLFYDSSDRQVALNGFHQGVVVQIETELGRIETVFDHLYPDGIPKQEWLNSFGGPLVEDFNGKFTVTETQL